MPDFFLKSSEILWFSYIANEGLTSDENVQMFKANL